MSYYTLDYPDGYKKSAKPYSIPQHLLLCGGPSNASDRVLKILSSQSLNPICGAILEIMDEVKVMLKHLFQTTNPLTLAIQTSGNGGNETIITNILEPGEKILVAVSGAWSEIIADMADRHGLDVGTVRKDPGETFSLGELENAVIAHRPALLFLVHGDSSTGAVQKLEGIGAMCHKYGCLFAIDAIASFCVHPIFVDRWEIDAISAASQKAVGATAGLSMLSFSPKAQEIIFNKQHRRPYYLDLKPLAAFWGCCNKPRSYHYTFSSNLLAALREGLAQVCEEGIVNMWKRHEASAQLLWDKLDELGLEYLVKNREIRFNAVICVKVPNGIDETAFLDYLKTKYRIDVSPGFGPTKGKAMRIGLMGQNSRPEVVQYLIEALRDGLKHFEE